MSGDAALIALIRDAAAGGRVVVEVDHARANRNGAPGYRTTDIVVPWFVAAAVSVYLGATFGAVSGLALFAVLAGLIVVALRPFNRRRAVERYRAAALASAENWQALWSLGALALRRTADGQRVAAPEGDWRAAARTLGSGAGEVA